MSAWDKWIIISMKAAGLLLMILLFIFYFTILLPLGLIFRLVSDPLRLAPRPGAGGSFFLPRKRVTETRESAANPY